MLAEIRHPVPSYCKLLTRDCVCAHVSACGKIVRAPANFSCTPQHKHVLQVQLLVVCMASFQVAVAYDLASAPQPPFLALSRAGLDACAHLGTTVPFLVSSWEGFCILLTTSNPLPQ